MLALARRTIYTDRLLSIIEIANDRDMYVMYREPEWPTTTDRQRQIAYPSNKA